MTYRHRGCNPREFRTLEEGADVVRKELLAQNIKSSRHFWVGDVKYKAERTAMYQPNITISKVK